MGAWSDLTLTAATLQGVAPVDFNDPEFDEYDSDRLTSNYLTAAKRQVEVYVTDVMPKLIASVEGPDTFLDDAADISNISNLLQEVLVWSFLSLYYEQQRREDGDIWHIKMERAEKMMQRVVAAMKNYLLADEDFLTALEGSSGEDLGAYEGIVWVG